MNLDELNNKYKTNNVFVKEFLIDFYIIHVNLICNAQVKF